MMTSSPIVVDENLALLSLIDMEDSGNIFITHRFVKTYWRKFLRSNLNPADSTNSVIHVCDVFQEDFAEHLEIYEQLGDMGVQVYIWTSDENYRRLVRPGLQFIVMRRRGDFGQGFLLAHTPVGAKGIVLWSDDKHDSSSDMDVNGVLITKSEAVWQICHRLQSIIAKHTA